MTDEEFYSTLEALREHTKVRRQESLTAADVEQFKAWDATYSHLDMVRFQKRMDQSGKGKPEGR